MGNVLRVCTMLIIFLFFLKIYHHPHHELQSHGVRIICISFRFTCYRRLHSPSLVLPRAPFRRLVLRQELPLGCWELHLNPIDGEKEEGALQAIKARRGWSAGSFLAIAAIGNEKWNEPRSSLKGSGMSFWGGHSISTPASFSSQGVSFSDPKVRT